MTTHQLVKIPLDQLRPGMFVGNVFNDRGVLLYSANTLIVDYAQVEALRRQGVTSVGINLQKGSGSDAVSEPAETIESLPSHSLDSKSVKTASPFDTLKIREAITLRDKTLEAVHRVMSAATTGRMFSLDTVADSVNSIIDLMLGDPDLLLNINRLKSGSPVEYIHSVNVSVLMIGFASALGYSRSELIDVGVGGILHDIGKIRFPGELLQKHGSCTRQELELFKKHPAMGIEIVRMSRTPVSPIVLSIIGQHHERINGSGYPEHLREKQIEPLAMVCALADMYDSLTCDGTYRRTYLPQEALALIFQGADEEIPRRLVEHFTKLLGIYPVGSFVKIDNGEMGVVIRNNRQKLLTPLVKILFDENGTLLATPYIRDLSIESETGERKPARVINSLDPHLFNVQDNQFYLQL
ncbi:MAG: HD domain-containing protein [Chitinispirillaceae bacterium]|nr:HD domain-containing protein [Chitinispirillaceae bacterium]